MLQAVKEIFADEPERPKPASEQPPPKVVPLQTAAASAPATPSSGFEQAAAGLIENGMKFLESLAAVAKTAQTGGGSPSSLVSRDPVTKAPVLSIPLPSSLDPDRIMRAIASVMSAFGGPR